MKTLELSDIADLRAYERTRDEVRAAVIALKKLRRVPIGPLVTVVFENRTTMLFQVQEMARAERMARDEQIQAELDVYNPLIPQPGELSMTLFIELTSEDELREWLPKLVGIERSVVLRVGATGDGASPVVARAAVDPAHEAQLTRDTVTASVHYVKIVVPEALRGRIGGEPVSIGVDHPLYSHETLLKTDTKESLIADWGS